MELLEKTFDLLEFVLLQNGRPVTPSEAAESTGLPLSTATRILGDLTARGYLDKVSRKSGYAPGPMVAALANRDNVYHRIALAANEPIRNLAAKAQSPVNLAVLRGTTRIMLVYSGSSPYWKPWAHLQFTDHASTATGRLLLAALPDKELAERYPELHFDDWPEVTSAAAFLKECARLRKEGSVRFLLDKRMEVMGHLIRVPDYPVAAIGFGTPDRERCEELFQASAETARQIAFHLKKNFSLF